MPAFHRLRVEVDPQNPDAAASQPQADGRAEPAQAENDHLHGPAVMRLAVQGSRGVALRSNMPSQGSTTAKSRCENVIM